MKDFLSTIMPGKGIYFAVEKGEKGFIHTACNTLDELTNKLTETNGSGRDAYFACASYERARYTDEKGKTRQRTAENAMLARSFWCDIDVGTDKAANGVGYATVKEAAEALRAFAGKYGLPHPMCVHSGGGIHSYWPLDEDIDKERWLSVAYKLKTLMKAASCPLLADPSRTADIASILRPVGTTNWKPERKGAQVKLAYKVEPTPFVEFRDKVEAALRAGGGQALSVHRTQEIPTYLQGREARVTGLGTELLVPPLETVRQALKPLDPDMERSKWWPCLAALASGYGEDGRTLAREWSSGALRGSPSFKYDAVDFDKQFTDALARMDLPGPKMAVASILYMAREAGWVGGCTAAAEGTIAAGPNWLSDMNEEYAFIEGNARIYRIAHRDFIHKPDFLTALANKSVVIETVQGPKRVNKAKAWLESEHRREHRSIVMRPGEPRVTHDNCLNTWSGFSVEPEEGDIAPFLKLLVRLAPDKIDHMHILHWLAHLLQKPAVKMSSALVMWSHQQGVGKNLLFECITKIIGPRHAAIIGQSELERDFNGWAADKVFVIGDEVSGQDRRQHVDKLKGLITGTTVQINEKFQPARETENLMNFVFLSNHSSALFMDDRDRRYHVVEVQASRLPQADANEFVKWRDGGGLGYLLQRLLQVDISSFDPKAPAPETAAKWQMVADNRSDLETWADSVMQTGPLALFGRELVTAAELAHRYMMDTNRREPPSAKAVVAVFKRFGAKARPNQIRLPNGTRVRVLALANTDRWQLKSEPECAAEMAKLPPSVRAVPAVSQSHYAQHPSQSPASH